MIKEKRNYKNLLKENKNDDLLEHVMCKKLISVGWNGIIYDCDFNLALNLPIKKRGKDIFISENLDIKKLISKSITVSDNCFSCIAGFGSSCFGRAFNLKKRWEEKR